MGTLLVRGILAVALLLTVVFPAWAQDSKGVGVVTALTGRADLKRPQAPQAQALKLRDNLFVRDVVDTQKESLARILLLGKSTVTVRELSRFEIREEVRPDGGERAVIDLAAGKIRVMVARRLMKPGDEVLIRTPNALASVRGSDGIFEVSTLPDGTPQTVVTGVEGEFDLTLPRTRPFTAMAEVATDASAGILVAQAPLGGGPVRGLDRVQILGAAGLQQITRSLVSLQDMLHELRGFRGPSVGSGTVQPAGRPAGDQVAASQTTRTGEQPGLTGGAPALGAGSRGIVSTPLYLPGGGGGPPRPPGPSDPRIPVLVYDCPGCANRINGYTGSGALFRAVNVSSAEFQTMTASQIAAFRVLAIPSTDALTTGVAGLLANPNVGTAVTGNQVITGLHTEHNVGQRDQFVINALQFAAQSGAGRTGLAAATDGCNASSCVGGKAGAMWIDQTGSFLKNAFSGTTVNRGLNGNSVTITNAASPVNSGSGLTGGQPLTNAGLSNWGNSVHSTFSNAPSGYSTIQTAGSQPVTVVKPAP